MAAVGEREALEACRTLFDGPADTAFLRALSTARVKQAFREKALRLHPDRFASASDALRRRQTERFQVASLACATVLAWLAGPTLPAGAREAGTKDRPPAAPPPPPPAAARAPAHDRAPFDGEGLGTFLRRRGAISGRDLIGALVRQRQGRPKLGELAVRWGWLTPSEVQTVLATRRPAPRFADRAVALGLLTPFRARTLLRHQRERQRRLGDFLVETGALARDELERLAALHRGSDRTGPTGRAGSRTASPA